MDAAVWERFGCERSVLVVDMEGFTASTREQGIVHYLRLIQRMQEISAPMLDRHGGQLVRFEADNLFAVFEAPERALAMMVETEAPPLFVCSLVIVGSAVAPVLSRTGASLTAVMSTLTVPKTTVPLPPDPVLPRSLAVT